MSADVKIAYNKLMKQGSKPVRCLKSVLGKVLGMFSQGQTEGRLAQGWSEASPRVFGESGPERIAETCEEMNSSPKCGPQAVWKK